MKNLERYSGIVTCPYLEKCRIIQAMIFPVISNDSEIWTLKNQGGKNIDTFELCWWTKHFKIPLTAKKANIKKKPRIYT